MPVAAPQFKGIMAIGSLLVFVRRGGMHGGHASGSVCCRTDSAWQASSHCNVRLPERVTKVVEASQGSTLHETNHL